MKGRHQAKTQMTPEQEAKLREHQNRQQVVAMAFELLKARYGVGEPVISRVELEDCFNTAERFIEHSKRYMEKG